MGFVQEKCFVSGEFNCEKGRWILADLNKDLPDSRKIKQMFSNGWFESFKKRNMFKCFNRYDESGDVDTTAVTSELPVLRSHLALYRSCEIFNADECGLYYRQSSTVTIALALLRDRKNWKDRVTFLFCVNATVQKNLHRWWLGLLRIRASSWV